MTEEVVKRMRLTKEAVEYIDQYTEEKAISRKHKNQTINIIIQEHKEMLQEKEWKDQLEKSLSENIAKEISKGVKKEVSRILLGVNNTDRNTQVLIELINGMMINNNQKSILTTEEVEAEGLVSAREKVAADIKNQKQKRDDWLSKQGGE